MIINPINVIHILVIMFNSSSYKNTTVNLKEKNLAENVKDLIQSDQFKSVPKITVHFCMFYDHHKIVFIPFISLKPFRFFG